MSPKNEKRIRRQVNAQRQVITYAVLKAAGYHASEDGKHGLKGRIMSG